MLNFVVTKVTSDFASRIWFYLFACLGLLSFLWTPKIQGAAFSRARIGIEIIYSLSVFVGHGVNRLKLRCKRVSLIW
jgi:hypothetical protein